jgi:hypothetical protein
MRGARMVLLLVVVLAAGLLVTQLRTERTDIRVFDADHMARLDTDMWRSYYDKQPAKLYLQLAQVLRDEFHMTHAHAYSTALLAARAAFEFKKGSRRADYEKALPDLRRYFADLRAISRTPFDVDAAAKTELEWWIVHRQRRAHAPGDLSHALAVAASALYGVAPESLRTYADERAIAMTIRDDRQEAGGVSEADWSAIERHLQVSWRALRASLRS